MSEDWKIDIVLKILTIYTSETIDAPYSENFRDNGSLYKASFVEQWTYRIWRYFCWYTTAITVSSRLRIEDLCLNVHFVNFFVFVSSFQWNSSKKTQLNLYQLWVSINWKRTEFSCIFAMYPSLCFCASFLPSFHPSVRLSFSVCSKWWLLGNSFVPNQIRNPLCKKKQVRN